ncbi:MAG TPA: TadE/TadG family type IV pilus assembly protein [Acidobacteriaceae bacterium]|nr:TadE/TadG family type IV pilus assembly protein [Acidobacteriaceae bacterium]
MMTTMRNYKSAVRKIIDRLLRRAGVENGSALVELALVVPVLSLLLLGSAEFAILAYDDIEVSSAARAGVAYGSQSTSTASDLTGMQQAALSDGGNVPGMTATAIQFWSCSNAPSAQSSTKPSCTGTAHVLHYVQVKTQAIVTPTAHLPGMSTITLNGVAIMRVQ